MLRGVMELRERLLAASSDGTTRKDMLKLKKIKLIAETSVAVDRFDRQRAELILPRVDGLSCSLIQIEINNFSYTGAASKISCLAWSPHIKWHLH
jgi:hypothetical protein